MFHNVCDIININNREGFDNFEQKLFKNLIFNVIHMILHDGILKDGGIVQRESRKMYVQSSTIKIYS